MTLGHFLLAPCRPDRLTKVLPEQLGRDLSRDPFRVLIEAEAFPYLRAPMQDVEQPDLATAPPIALVDRIAWAIPVDEALRCIDHGPWAQRLSNPSGSPCCLGIVRRDGNAP